MSNSEYPTKEFTHSQSGLCPPQQRAAEDYQAGIHRNATYNGENLWTDAQQIARDDALKNGSDQDRASLGLYPAA
jgi:hypothetical protein